MRKMIFTRGAPGSGKSTLLNSDELALAPHILSQDSIRLLLSGPVMSDNGKMSVNQEYNVRVWTLHETFANERMRRGETIVFDSTATNKDILLYYTELARKHRYEMAVLDFSNLDLEYCLERNRSRPEIYRVPEDVVRTMHGNLRAFPTPRTGEYHVIDAINPNAEKEIQQFLRPVRLDLTQASRVIHVGDLHGCSQALDNLIKNMDGIRSDDVWIFHGDCVDRGPDNAGIMRRMLELTEKPNVHLLWGNHEDHLRRWADGESPVSTEFGQKTLPQLEAGGLTKDDAQTLVSRLKDMMLYKRGEQVVVCTHAGLPALPTHFYSLSREQYSHGPGEYETDVDAIWDQAYAGIPIMQVHGHRNHFNRPTIVGNSINLEEEVEYGGHLRAVSMNSDGRWHDVSVKNTHFLPMRERRLSPVRDIIPRWINKDDGKGVQMSPELRKTMEGHKGVRLKPMPNAPHIVSFNFTKNVFYDQSWDDVVVRARGLFINQGTGEIVARSYDKFFNVNERDETKPDNLYPSLAYPVRAWVKENGFLGIAGYDSETDSLFTASKSTSSGEFADMFREILFNHLEKRSPKTATALARDLRDLEASLAFEVIDPVRDPHIVDYPEPKVVLLDVIRRSSEFEKLDDRDRERFAKKYGFETKKMEARLPNSLAMAGWSKRMSGDTSIEHEGWVLEDANGFQWKQKSVQYAFWKWMRSAVDSAVRAMRENVEPNIKRYVDQAETRGMGFLKEEAQTFLNWAVQKTVEELESTSIIEMRKEWEAAGKPGLNPTSPPKP